MDIDIKKNGKVTLKDTPYFVPINDTNISFSNMDVGTAMITFQIKKNDLPLQVSKKNVWVYAYLESRNGTRSEVIQLEDVDPMQGKVALQLDQEFLVGATNSTVDGQLYVSLHKWNDVDADFSDTVALQQFSFDVRDALVNKISAVTKTQYIRTFDQLVTEVKDRVAELEENVGNIETLVDRVNQAATNAIDRINDTKDKMISEMNTQFDDTEQAVADLKEDTINRLNTAATNYINDIKNAKDDLLTMIDDEHLITTQVFEEYKDDFMEEINTRLDEYQQFIDDNKEDFQGILDGLNWQKYKLTEDDGFRIRVSDTDPVKLGSGFYQMWRLKNAPEGSDDNSQYWNIDITEGATETKQIVATISATGKTYQKNIHKNEDKGWKQLTSNRTDTDWLPINTINDVKNNSAFNNESDNGFQSAYRVIEESGVTRKMVRINVSNVSHQTVIANLPKGFAKNVQFHYVRVPINMGYGLVGIFPSGSVYVYIESSMRENWAKGDSYYFYGQFEWTE